MFTFFRKYQWFVYLIAAPVIILSFSFFGTYSAFTSGRGDDPVVFTTVAGKNITRSEFNDYVHFLSMDASLGEGGRSDNALNDGVIEHDIIATPIGEVLVRHFEKEFGKEWGLKFKREKAFQPYKHPQAQFVSAQQVWSYFAPDVKTSLEEYQQLAADVPLELYRKKAALFLAEKKFPAAYLRQVLHYQQKQFDWIEPDASLQGRPLSLFGYQQVGEWFGVPFVEKSAEFIINVAAKARLMGMTVSKGEVLASLYKNVQHVAKRPDSGMDADVLLKQTLLCLGMDESRVAKVWEDVLLFRRALTELPRSVVLSPAPFIQRLQSEAETVTIEGFQLQPCFRPESVRDLFKVETWLDGVTKKQKATSLIPSQEWRSCDDVMTSFPEFVERKFALAVSAVDMTKLSSQVRVKDIWTWQNDHWDEVKNAIPLLKENETPDRESRFRALENLPEQLRVQADEMAKTALVTAHPEWLSHQLDAGKAETKKYGLRLKGGAFPFEGIKDRKEFIRVLEKAAIGEPLQEPYSQDGKHFYRITVMDRSLKEELVPLPELLADGTLDAVLDAKLEITYDKIRQEKPTEFKKEDGTWKPFASVKDTVGEVYFAPLLKTLTHATAEWKEKLPGFCQWNDAKTAQVAVRFLPLLEEKMKNVRSGNDTEVTSPFTKGEEGLSLETRPLQDLFSLTKFSEKISRAALLEKPAFKDAFSCEKGAWLPTRYSQHFGVCAIKVIDGAAGEYQDTMRGLIHDLQSKIGHEVMERKATEYGQEFFGAPVAQ